MNGELDCDHDKYEIDNGRSDTISWATAKAFLTRSSTQSRNVTVPVCTEVANCDFAREEAISRFTTLRKEIENTSYTGLSESLKEGGGGNSALSERIEAELEKFEYQSGKLPSELHRLDFTESELIDLWEDAKKLENAIEEFEQESLDQDHWTTAKFRGRMGFDNLPKEVQEVSSVKDIIGNVQTEAEQELKEEHNVSKNELEKRVNSEDETESETESQSQEQEIDTKTETEERRQHHR